MTGKLSDASENWKMGRWTMPFMTITLLYCTVLLQMHVHSHYSRPTGRHGSILGSPQTRQVSFSFSSSYHSTSISLQQSWQVPHVKGRSTRKVWGWIRHDWLRLSNCCVQRNATAWRSQLPEVLHRPILQMRVIVKNYCTVLYRTYSTTNSLRLTTTSFIKLLRRKKQLDAMQRYPDFDSPRCNHQFCLPQSRHTRLFLCLVLFLEVHVRCNMTSLS